MSRPERTSASCNECPAELGVWLDSSSEVTTLLNKIGWYTDSKEDLCPACHERRIKQYNGEEE